MTDEMPNIRSVHTLYEDLTQIQVILSMEKVFKWREWLARGYTHDDLRSVVMMLQAKIKSGQKTFTCLNFRNLIGNLEWFDEDLGEARALARMPKPTARDKILEQTGRPKQMGLGDTVQSAESVMKGNAALAELLKLRDSLQ
jgi:hypothetical protein